jgi:tRNA pseudouridine55 synthase
MAHDVGQALQCGAYLSSLRRTKIGDFSADDAIPLSILQEKVKEAYSING